MSQSPKETLDQLRHFHQVTYCEPLSDEFLVQTLKDLLHERQRAEIKARFRDWPPSRVVALIQATNPEPPPLQPIAPSSPATASPEPSSPIPQPARAFTPNQTVRKRGAAFNV